MLAASSKIFLHMIIFSAVCMVVPIPAFLKRKDCTDGFLLIPVHASSREYPYLCRGNYRLSLVPDSLVRDWLDAVLRSGRADWDVRDSP
jgi:hypothetical protein